MCVVYGLENSKTLFSKKKKKKKKGKAGKIREREARQSRAERVFSPPLCVCIGKCKHARERELQSFAFSSLL